MSKALEITINLRPNTGTVIFKNGFSVPVISTKVVAVFDTLQEGTDFLVQNEEQVIDFIITGNNSHLPKPKEISELVDMNYQDMINLDETQGGHDNPSTENDGLFGIPIDDYGTPIEVEEEPELENEIEIEDDENYEDDDLTLTI